MRVVDSHSPQAAKRMRDCGVALKPANHSESFGTGEETAVDRVNNWLSTDLPTTKEPSIETLECILSALNFLELDVNVAFRVRIEGDMNHMTVFFFALGANVIFELLDPALTLFPVYLVSLGALDGMKERTHRVQMHFEV